MPAERTTVIQVVKITHGCYTDDLITTCVSDKEVVLDGVSCDVALPDYTSEPELAITECSPYVVTQTPLAGTMISDTTVVTITVTDEYNNMINMSVLCEHPGQHSASYYDLCL
jgi:hypothetical protein